MVSDQCTGSRCGRFFWPSSLPFWVFLFYNYALTQIPASQVAVFINGIPVVTAIGAWFILGESLTLLQMAGGLLVLIAVIVANKPQPSRQTASG